MAEERQLVSFGTLKTMSDKISKGLEPLDQLLAIPAEKRLWIICNLETPPQCIKQRQGRGGLKLSYVEGHYIKRLLNYFFPGAWEFERTGGERVDDQLTVFGKLTIHCKDGARAVSSTGSAEIKYVKNSKKPVSLGDDWKGAETDCLKKCASCFGFAADVYSGQNTGGKVKQKPATTKEKPAPKSEPADPGIGDPPEGSSLHENIESLSKGEITLLKNCQKSHLWKADEDEVKISELAWLRKHLHVVRVRKALEWWYGAGYKGKGERARRVALEEAAKKDPAPGAGATTIPVKRAAIETMLKPLTCPERPTEFDVLMAMTENETGNVADLSNNEVLRIYTELSRKE